jgi:hypothetical protein
MKITVPDLLRKHWAMYQQEMSRDQHLDKPLVMGNLTPIMEQKLLGELYDDNTYLSELMDDKDFADYPDENVSQLVNDGLRYLSTRIEFCKLY